MFLGLDPNSFVTLKNEMNEKKTFNTSLFFLFPILDFLKLEPQFASLCFKICQVLKERLEISAVK